MNWFYKSPRLTMPQLRAKAERALKQGSAGNKSKRAANRPARAPVRVEGRVISRSFWGKAWCEHIESYSDYDSRLGRGRSYLYAGAVLDLQVREGEISALVQGSQRYRQTIEVKPLTPKQRDALLQRAAGQIDSLVALLRGEIPPALVAAMTDPSSGVFPSAKQIDLMCSCPDSALLCKHLAAILYGFGARLDASPELLFLLRGLPVDALVQRADTTHIPVQDIPAAKQATGDLAALFGIDLIPALPTPPPPTRVTREYLKVLGVPTRTIDAWLREAVLLKTTERDVYERTPEANHRIAALLAR